jgi:hypothetical protein
MAYRYTGAPIIPPRASVAQDPSFLPQREAEGRWAQIKKNGTNTVVMVHPDRKVVAWDRRGELQKAWQFTEIIAAIFAAIPGNDWYVFNGELINAKARHDKNIKNQIYLYDILVCDGIGLTGTKYSDRYQLLFDILANGRTFNEPTPDTHFWRLDDYISIARVYNSGFVNVFNSLVHPEDEGLVCRQPDGIYTGPNADAWMTKHRRKELTKLY